MLAPTIDCWLAWLQSVSFGVSLARRQGAEAGKAGKTGKASKTGKGRRIEEKAQLRDGEQHATSTHTGQRAQAKSGRLMDALPS